MQKRFGNRQQAMQEREMFMRANLSAVLCEPVRFFNAYMMTCKPQLVNRNKA